MQSRRLSYRTQAIGMRSDFRVHPVLLGLLTLKVEAPRFPHYMTHDVYPLKLSREAVLLAWPELELWLVRCRLEQKQI